MKRVVVLDYGSGNLRSAERALAQVGADVTVTSNVADAETADGVVVPGVGAFAACMAGVRDIAAADFVRTRVAAARPVLGICVGMQILYESGEEHGVETAGIGVLPGHVQRLTAPILPHMGWNTVAPPEGSRLFAGVEDERFYFVHSYAVLPSAPAGGDGAGLAETLTTHGEQFVAAVESGAVAAAQFHPEKSGDAGLAVLRNWIQSLS